MSTLTGKRKLDADAKEDIPIILLFSVRKKQFGQYYLEGQTMHSGTHSKLGRIGTPFPLASWVTWKDQWETTVGLAFAGVQFTYEGTHFQDQSKQFDRELPTLKAFLAYLSSRAEAFSVRLSHEKAWYSDNNQAVCGPINKYLTILKELCILNVELNLYDPIWDLMDKFSIEPLSTWKCNIYFGFSSRSYLATEEMLEGAFHNIAHLKWKGIRFSIVNPIDTPRFTLLPHCTSYSISHPDRLTLALPATLGDARYIDLLPSFTGIRELYLSYQHHVMDPTTIDSSLYKSKILEVYDGPLTFDNLLLMMRSNSRLKRVMWRSRTQQDLSSTQAKELTREYSRHPSLIKLHYTYVSNKRIPFGQFGIVFGLLSPDAEQKKAERLCIRDEGWCRVTLAIAFLRANRDNALRNSILALAPTWQFQDEKEPPFPLTSPKHINLDKCLNTKFARAEIERNE